MKHTYFISAVFAATCSFVFLFTTNAFAAGPVQIVFTTTSQNVDVGTISQIITVQTQDTNGASASVSSSTKLQFFSSSPTGIFYDASISTKKCGSAISNTGTLTMSTNSSNKGFCYSDSASGTFTLTVSVQGQSWTSATQNINIIDNGSTVSDDLSNDNSTTTTATTTDTTSATSTATTTIVTQTVYISSHANSEDLSNLEITPAFAISAGRERTASVGASVQFSAQYNIAQNLSMYTLIFNWSFGDGTQALGQDISHTYKYPGDYTVILNGICNGINAVSRTLIHVSSPDIMLVAIVNGDTQVINSSDTEINLGRWKLKDSLGEFIFPADTIVLSDKSITFSHEDTKIQANPNDKLYLLDPSGEQVAMADFIGDNFISASSSEAMSTIIEQNLNITIQKAQMLVSLLKQYHSGMAQNILATNTEKVAMQNIPVKNSVQVSQKQNLTQTASVVESLNPVLIATSSRGFWAQFLGIFHF